MPIVALSLALGNDVGMLRQCHVYQSTLFCRHRLQPLLPVSSGIPGRAFGQTVQAVAPAILVLLHVNDYVRSAFQSTTYEETDDSLQVAQSIATAADQEACVFSLDFKHEGTISEVVQDVGIDFDLHVGDEFA